MLKKDIKIDDSVHPINVNHLSSVLFPLRLRSRDCAVQGRVGTMFWRWCPHFTVMGP